MVVPLRQKKRCLVIFPFYGFGYSGTFFVVELLLGLCVCMVTITPPPPMKIIENVCPTSSAPHINAYSRAQVLSVGAGGGDGAGVWLLGLLGLPGLHGALGLGLSR